MNHLKNFAKLVVAILLFQSQCFAYSGGNGTEANPFQIANPNDLQELMNDKPNWDKQFILTNDIDCTTITDPKPIGTTKSTPFSGTFDGSLNTISNLKINSPEQDYVGLIGYNTGTIKYVNLEKCNIVGKNYVGGLCGLNLKNISYCKVNAEIVGNNNIGGFVGSNSGSIINCNIVGKIDGITSVGGFAGLNSKGDIISSYSEVDCQGEKNVGGFCGFNSNAKIYFSYSISTTKGIESVGGFCGYFNGGTIFSAYCTGETSGDKKVSGFCGELNISTIKSCFWDIDASKLDTAGLSLYEIARGKSTIEMKTQSTYNNWNFQHIWQIHDNEYPKLRGRKDYSGGSGTEIDPWKISNADDLNYLMYRFDDWHNFFILTNDIDCSQMIDAKPIGQYNGHLYSTDFVFSGNFDGNSFKIHNLKIKTDEANTGLFGYNKGKISNLTITDCEIINGNRIGGICALNYGSIINSSFEGKISNVETKYTYSTGGLCGLNGGEIIDCYANAIIVSDKVIGGLCGENKKGLIKNSYSTGSIEGNTDLGGFCGLNSGEIFLCYSEVQIIGTEDFIGGFCGQNSGEINRCYSTGDVSGNSNTAGFSGKNTGFIHFCYATGNSSGKDKISGFCSLNSGMITDSYANGNALSEISSAGFCEENSYGKIIKSYSTGFMTGKFSYSGGFCRINNNASVKNCYWDKDVAGTTISPGGGFGKTTSEMKDKSTFEDWNFNTLWSVSPDEYPKHAIKHKYSGGSGVESDPWQLANVVDLKHLMDWWFDWNDHFILTENIDCSDIKIATPIGNIKYEFTGSFDGQGFTISNLTINLPDTIMVGLFGKSSADIENLNVTNCNITGKSQVGGLCGQCNGNIINCYVTGEVTGIDVVVGGLIGGYYKNVISNCKSETNVKSKESYVGGLIGSMGAIENPELFTNNKSTGNVVGKDYVGGLIGSSERNLVLKDSYSSGNVKGNNYVGGFIGNGAINIKNCFAEGNVEGVNFTGGFVGRFSYYKIYTIDNCFSTGNVSSSGRNVGGFCGSNIHGKLYNSYSSGIVIGVDSVGGFCGTNSGTIQQCHSDSINVTGNNFVGCFCGSNKGLIFKSNSEHCKVDGSNNVGGFCGTNFYYISFCSSNSDVISSGNEVGGFCGKNNNFILNSFANGNVRGVDKVGGFCGNNSKSTIIACYSTGLVNGQGNSLGGFCGDNSLGDINGCYWDTQTSGIGTSSGGEGRNTSEMKSLSNYPLWNFNAIWTLKSNQYPEFGERHYYSGGDGTELNPWRISNTDDLEYLMNYHIDWGSSFIITENLDCSSISLQIPIGNSEYMPFSGSFNGNNQSVTNFNMNYLNINNGGLIGYNSGKIHNLEITNSSITANKDLGILCGTNIGTISDCSIKDSKINGFNGTGGLCGKNNKTIENSSAINCTIDGILNVGGFCGINEGSITNSNSECIINGDENVGGFCGMNLNSNIYSCNSKSEVNGAIKNIGGFCGYHYSLGKYSVNHFHGDQVYYEPISTISESFSVGKVQSDAINTGGFVGRLLASSYGKTNIENCYSETEVRSNGDTTGGFCGFMSDYHSSTSKIKNCYSIGIVLTSGSKRGGFIGDKLEGYSSYIDGGYWDIETSGLDSSRGGTGKTTLEMYNQSTFVRWNFDSIWYMPPNDYPKLHPYKLVSVDDNVVIVDSKFMSIYPNPTSNIFSIEYNVPESGQIYLELYDILGNKVFNYDAGYKFSGINNDILNISFLPTGSYSLVLKIENMIFTKKVIKID